MNTKGIKFLAVLAVLAMAFAAFAVVTTTDDSDADVAKSSKWTYAAQGPLDFAATGFVYSTFGFTNADLGNDISVRYDADTKTYYVTGTINKQVYTGTVPATSKAIVEMYGADWLKEKGTNYALAFGFVSQADGSQVKVGTVGDWSAAKAEGTVEDCIIVLKQAGKAPVEIKTGELVTTYYIDTSGATFATSNSNKTGYTALYGANALADTAKVSAGTDTKGGTWTYSGTTLTLNNYNGNETFNLDTMTKVILAGDNTITLKGALTALSSNALAISNDSGVATLAINITTDADGARGIDSAGALSISGVDIAISIAGKATAAIGIEATTFSVFNSTQVISVLPIAYDAAEYSAGVSVTATDIKSSDITVVSGYKGFVATTLDVSASSLDATASLYAIQATDFSVSQTSSVEALALGLTATYHQPYGIAANKIENKSYSEIAANGILLGAAAAGASENYAYIENTGNMLIKSGSTFTNKTDGVFDNSGVIGVIGGIDVNAGTFNNDGVINTLKNVTAIGALNFSDGDVYTLLQTRAKTITTGVAFEMVADGTISLSPIVVFNDGTSDVVTSTAGQFVGTATIVEDTTVPTKGKILTMNLTATTVKGDNKYTSRVALSSSPVGDAGNVIYSVVSSGSYTDGVYDAKSTAGTVKTTAVAGMGKLDFATLADASAVLTVSGGDLVNDGAIVIGSLSDGTILTKGTFTNTGSIISAVAIDMDDGTFLSTGTVALAGNLDVNGGAFTADLVVDTGSVITVKGTILAEITYAGTFTPAATTANPNPTPIAFLNTIDVAGKGASTGFKITASQPIASETGVFALTALDKIATKDGAAFILEDGAATIETAGDVGLAASGTVTAMAGTTLTNTAALKVSGVIAIQDGATFNYFIEDVTETYTYGTLAYTISFANDGYTFYGNLAFALANAEEGMILYLAANETISKDTAVKAGIQLVFAENAQLTIAGTADKPVTLTMGTGAAFILDDGAAVKIQNAKVSGDIEYDENELFFDELVVGATMATVTGQPAVGLESAYIEFTALTYTDGTVEMVAGYFGGDITIGATMNGTKVKTAAQLAIDGEAISKVNIIAGDNAAKTKVVLDGTIRVDAGNVNLFAPITGEGAIVLGAGATATLANNVKESIVIGNGVDGFALDNVKSVAAADDLLKFTSVAATATEKAYVKVSGTLTDGILTVIGDTATDGLDLEQNAAADTPTIGVLVIPADTTFTVIKDGDAFVVDIDGAVRVSGEFYYYTEDTDKFGKVNYDITYEDAGDTVYAKLAGAAAIAPAGTDFEITKAVNVDVLILNKGQTLTVSGKDGVLNVATKVIIGTPATSLGATDSIVGKVHLGAGAYAIAYSGSDISGANFVYGDDVKAKYSNYSIANVTYCDVYAAEGVAINTVNGELGVPQIEGMKFQGWVQYVAAAANIGESDVYARTVAVQYKITLTSVEGVVYKVAGSSAVVLDSPFYVDAGTVVNAVPASGYTGSTQTWTVNKDQTITAQAYSPTPAPEPTPAEKEAFGITEILLVVLVILIAVMVIVVLLRMNRS